MKKPCCEVASNLDVKEDRADRSMAQCKVCGARHYRMVAYPGRVGVRMKESTDV